MPRPGPWRSEENLEELLPSFHHMGPGNQTQVMGLYLLSRLKVEIFIKRYKEFVDS